MLSFYDKIACYKNSEQKLNSKNGISWSSLFHTCVKITTCLSLIKFIHYLIVK